MRINLDYKYIIVSIDRNELVFSAKEARLVEDSYVEKALIGIPKRQFLEVRDMPNGDKEVTIDTNNIMVVKSNRFSLEGRLFKRTSMRFDTVIGPTEDSDLDSMLLLYETL